MKFYVGITDESWFNHLQSLQPDEVNFWRPLARNTFKALRTGELFLFKLHYPKRQIVGGATFVSYARLPLSVAWEAFGEKNGTSDEQSLQISIHKYREKQGLEFDRDPLIGCVVLNEPFFLQEEEWIPEPRDWHPSIVQGKGYDTTDLVGAELISQLGKVQRVQRTNESSQLYYVGGQSVIKGLKEIVDESFEKDDYEEQDSRLVGNGRDDNDARFGSEYTTRSRLGQGIFRILVMDAYQRRCAMTGYDALPALQASHIKPYTKYGPHRVSNGLLLRVDLHVMFDRGYITIDRDYKIIVSDKLKQNYQHSEGYYKLHGQSLVILPQRAYEQPSLEYIDWHNENVFL